MKMFRVGGCVRDEIMGIQSKDIDFAVEAESFDAMRAELVSQGFEIFLTAPEFLTLRAHFPRDHAMFGKTTADFVLCRKDGSSSDGRRPDEVFPGTLLDDLRRRDFTMNAMAFDENNQLIDPFGGCADIMAERIRFVGDPMLRLLEDGLRAIRGLRFMITKGFIMHPDSWDAINDSAGLLHGVSTERIRDELHKMFSHDTRGSFELLACVNSDLRDEILRDGIKLLPAMGKKVKAF